MQERFNLLISSPLVTPALSVLLNPSGVSYCGVDKHNVFKVVFFFIAGFLKPPIKGNDDAFYA